MAEKTNNTRQAAWLMLGNLFSFGFAIVSSIILSRYFDKTEYGTYKQVLYIYSALLSFFTLGIPNAFSYFLPRSPLDQAKSLISKLTNIFFLLGGVFSLLLFAGAGLFADFLNNPDLATPLRIFSPTPLLMMPTIGIEGILATYRQTKFMTVYVLITRIAMLLCVVMPVLLWGGDCNQAVAGFVLASLISFVAALYFKYYPVRSAGREKTTQTYKTIFAFCLPVFISNLTGSLSHSTDQFFISRYFGAEVFADFSNGSLELPFVSMIITAMLTVLTPLFSKEVFLKSNFRQNILPTWLSAFGKASMLIYPMTIFCMLEATNIMVLLYGNAYEASGDYFKIKLLQHFVKVMTLYPMIVALNIVNFWQKASLFFLLFLVGSEFAAVKLFHDPLLITAISTFKTIAMYLVMLWYIAKKVNVSMMTLIPWKTIGKVCFIMLVSGCAMILFSKYIYISNITLLQILLDLSVFCAVYLTMCIPLKLNYWSIIKPLLVSK